MKKELTFKNIYNVKRIKWESENVENYCPLGEDWCTYKYRVEMRPHENLFDYDVLHRWITDNLQGKTHTCEEAAHKLYQYINQEVRPYELKVTVLYAGIEVEI